MSKVKVGASLTLALFVPAIAQAKAPTREHVRQYLREYHAVRHQFGARAAGCNLIERKGSCHVKAQDGDVRKSLAVLDRDLAPPVPVPTHTTYTPVGSSQPTSVTTNSTASASSVTSSASTAPSGGLESCIIQHESGGDPQAVSGPYQGIGQWQQSTWVADGGTKYAATPLGASYSDQEKVLSSEGTSGMIQQQGQYDGCG